MVWLLRAVGAFAVLLAVACWALFLSPRPPNTTDPAVLAGDGTAVDYCALPILDGSGLRAADIPKANTPGCGWDTPPLPVLAACTEPLPGDAVDMRGLWRATTDGRFAGHVERIEQCGERVVVTTAGVIHDSGPNSTGGLTTNDVEGRAFTLFGREFCARSTAQMVWNDGVLDFHAFGWGPVVVRRWLEGDELVWEYVDGSVTRMERVCHWQRSGSPGNA